MPNYNPDDPFNDDDVDYYGYGEEAPQMAPPVPLQDWRTDRDARQTVEDAETARRVAAHPSYDDPRFFERQNESSRNLRGPGHSCLVHNRFLSPREAIQLKGRCSWCNPELHESYALSKRAPSPTDKKAVTAYHKAQAAQEEIQKMNDAIAERERLKDAHLMVDLSRKCTDCDVVLKAGYKYRCQPCIDKAYAAIPEKYREFLPTPTSR